MSKKTTMTEITRKVAEDTGATIKDSKIIIDAFVASLREVLLDETEIRLNGVGTFKIGVSPAKEEREGIINPTTGERGILPAIPEYSKVKFTVSAALKQELKDKTVK